ncbi:MAG: cytochrome b/b6 domain-containing protein [Caulobacterales bacterium]
MQTKNSSVAYGWLAIALHWISAIGVIWLYFSGDTAGEAATREARAPLLAYHMSLGACFFLFLAGRVIWSFTQPKPAPLSSHKWLTPVAKAVQHLFLAMIAVMIISGPLAALSTANPIKVFDWFAIPSPFAERNQSVHKIAETVHGLTKNLFWPLLILHVLGAAKSLVINKDRTVQRMLWVRKEN